MAAKDKLTIAMKQNLAGTTRLCCELNRIKREQKLAMRMHSNARQMFRNKYEIRIDRPNNLFDGTPDTSSASILEMGHSIRGSRRHAPCVVQPSCIMNSSLNMHDLHNLLFTDGEIDIEKILCLYLLAAHRTESLHIPPKPDKCEYPKHCPLERLIDRSQRSLNEKFGRTLPLYILDVPPLVREPYDLGFSVGSEYSTRIDEPNRSMTDANEQICKFEEGSSIIEKRSCTSYSISETGSSRTTKQLFAGNQKRMVADSSSDEDDEFNFERRMEGGRASGRRRCMSPTRRRKNQRTTGRDIIAIHVEDSPRSVNRRHLKHQIDQMKETYERQSLKVTIRDRHRRNHMREPAKPVPAYVAYIKSPKQSRKKPISPKRRPVPRKISSCESTYSREVPSSDPRLTDKVIVNMKILKILESVLRALQSCKSDLLTRFLRTVRSKKELYAIMNKPKMIKYVKSLYGQNIVSNCESFYLINVHPKMVDMQITAEPLFTLVRLIRHHVLKKPNAAIWREYTVPFKREEEEQKAKDNPYSSMLSLSAYLDPPYAVSSQNSIRQLSKLNTQASDNSLQPGACLTCTCIDIMDEDKLEEDEQMGSGMPANIDDYSLNIDTDGYGYLGQRETIAHLQPKIRRNLQLGFSDVRIDNSMRVEDLPLEELAMLLTKKVEKESEMEYLFGSESSTSTIDIVQPPKPLFRQTMMEPRSFLAPVLQPAPPPPPMPMPPPVMVLPDKPSEKKISHYSYRQASCSACMAKWRAPFPSPKISKLKKVPLPELKDTSYFSSKSAQRISVLINEEVKRLEETARGPTSQTRIAELQAMKALTQKSGYAFDTRDNSIEIIDLGDYELAKIRQEIKEMETLKKLKKFLNAPM